MPHSYLWSEAYSLSSYVDAKEIENIGKIMSQVLAIANITQIGMM